MTKLRRLKSSGSTCATVTLTFLFLCSHPAEAALCGVAAPEIITAQYNSYRTSANLAETALNPSSVQSGFGYLFQLAPSAGRIYAQPLILHNFTVAGTCHATVLFIATMKNQILAFDGDNPTATDPIWESRGFTTAASSGSVFHPALYCKTNVGFRQAGILSTPVIDPTNQLMYFVTLNDTQKAETCSTEGSTGWVYTLHAMSLKYDFSFGRDYIPAHDINGDLQPYGFVAGQQLQRPALADQSGAILVGFGFGTSSSAGNELQSSYEGWMAEYNSCATGSASCAASTCFTNVDCAFFLSTTFSPGPLSPVGAGVWMSGVGPSSDGTFYAYSTGNGCRPEKTTSVRNCTPMADNALGDSVVYRPLGVNSNQGSTFTPENSTETAGYQNYYVDDYNDLDVSSGGVMMLPPSPPVATSSYLVASGKAGQTYLLKTAHLGGYTADPYQSFSSAVSVAPCTVPFPVYPQTPIYSGILPWEGGCAEVHNPAYWDLGSGKGFYFVWGFGDFPRGYFFNGSSFEIDAFGQTPPIVGPVQKGGGGALAISANGYNPGTALLWAVVSDGFTDTGAFQGAALVAFQLYSTADAYEIEEVFNSEDANGQDFTAQRYVVPVVNNGKVYVSAVSGSNGAIFVYGPCSEGPDSECGTQPDPDR